MSAQEDKLVMEYWRVDYVDTCFAEKRKFRTRVEAEKCADELAQSGDFVRIEINGPYDANDGYHVPPDLNSEFWR